MSSGEPGAGNLHAGFCLLCTYQGDISTGRDALDLTNLGDTADAIITNPPYIRVLTAGRFQNAKSARVYWILDG
jgi:hypothetical protein